jgi:peptide/nickel transport system substrate-binding protein
MRKYLCMGLVLMLAAFVAGCGSSGKGQSNGTASNSGAEGTGSSKQYPELRWGQLTFAGNINWTNNEPGQVALIESLAVQGLVEVEEDGKLKPCLATSIEHPNPTTYIYHIKSGVKFSDGKPLTVADVVYSLDQDMKGLGTSPRWVDVASVSSRGDSTVVVKLKHPEGKWPEALAFSGQIVEKAQAERVGEKALGSPGAMPIGTGPWKFDSYKPEVSVQLSPNPYWNGAPRPAQKITINIFKEESAMALALRSGVIDGASGYASQSIFANVPETHRESNPENWLAWMAMNAKQAPFNDGHVRRAIWYATDVQGILKALFPRGGASEDVTIAPPGGFGAFNASQVQKMLSTLPRYSFDLAAAKRELAKSAYPHGFATELVTFESEPYLLNVAQVIAYDLSKIGITVKVHEAPDTELTSYLEASGAHKVKMLMSEFATVTPNPDGVVEPLVSPAVVGESNLAYYDNPEIGKLFAEESENQSLEGRLGLLGKILKIAGEEAPYVPVFAHSEFTTLSNKYVAPTFSWYTGAYTPWALDVKLAS